MAGRLHSRRGASSHDSDGGSFLLCSYNLMTKNPLLIGCLLITGIVINFKHFLFPSAEDLLVNIAHHTANITVPSNTQEDASEEPNAASRLPEAEQHQQEQHAHEHGLSIQSSTIQHLQSLSEFPKIVHLIWNDKNILNTTYQMLEHGAKNLQRLNPDWQFIVHDFEEVDRTIQQFTEHPDIMNSSMQNDLLHAHIVEKTDAFRLITIYQTGGLYVDVDRVM